MPTKPAAASASIVPGRKSIVMTGPPGEKRWGFYQFPDMWRGPKDGLLYCAVNVGFDSFISDHEPSRFFVSRDSGASWQQTTFDKVDRSPDVFTFSDGSQVSFGPTRFIYHVHGYGPLMEEWMFWDTAKLGMTAVTGELLDGYQNTKWRLYRVGDVPRAQRGFVRSYRKSANDPWQRDEGVVEVPDMLFYALSRTRWWDKDGKEYWETVPPKFLRVWPKWGEWNVVVLPDDTMLWAHFCGHPESERLGRLYCAVALLESRDKGKTWQLRSMIADDTELTTDGYSGDEHTLAVMPGGDLLCVMRTVLGDVAGSTQWLASTRSRDQGRTWSRPVEKIAEFSVTPLMMTLKNGMVAVAYGRPGVYVRASGDAGKTWRPELPVVGPSEAELMTDRWWDVQYDHRSDNKISCGNLGAVVTGDDRFLLAYSDFRHTNEKGVQVKAVITQEFGLTPSPLVGEGRGEG